MSIKINVSIGRNITPVNDTGLTLAILRYAIPKETENVGEILRINNVEELHENYKAATKDKDKDKDAAEELFTLEYLLNAGVNLLVYPILADGENEIKEADILNIEDIEMLNYDFLIVPHRRIDQFKEAELKLIAGLVEKLDIETYITVDNVEALPSIKTPEGEVLLIKTPKMSALANAMEIQMKSNVLKAFEVEPIITAAQAYLVRKVKMLQRGTPWIPIAGEENGVMNEGIRLTRQIGTLEKNKLQAAGINPLVMKRGVGNILTSQTTMAKDLEDTQNDLRRGNIVTLTLFIKKFLKRYAEKTLFKPNTLKTWNQVDMDLKAQFATLEDQGALTDSTVAVGLHKTMTQEDINNRVLKIYTDFKPTQAIETIEANVVIKETTGEYSITMDGGL